MNPIFKVRGVYSRRCSICTEWFKVDQYLCCAECRMIFPKKAAKLKIKDRNLPIMTCEYKPPAKMKKPAVKKPKIKEPKSAKPKPSPEPILLLPAPLTVSEQRLSTINSKFGELNKSWIEATREHSRNKRMVSQQKRKKHEASVISDFELEDWIACMNYFGNKCAYCGSSDKLSQDHFIAVSKGGDYTKDNIIPVCKSCNSSKRDKDIFFWYKNRDFYTEERERIILDYLASHKKISS